MLGLRESVSGFREISLTEAARIERNTHFRQLRDIVSIYFQILLTLQTLVRLTEGYCSTEITIII